MTKTMLRLCFFVYFCSVNVNNCSSDIFTDGNSHPCGSLTGVNPGEKNDKQYYNNDRCNALTINV